MGFRRSLKEKLFTCALNLLIWQIIIFNGVLQMGMQQKELQDITQTWAILMILIGVQLSPMIFRTDNADGDEDRIRKKHAEFLVKDFIPSEALKGIAVYNDNVKNIVDELVEKLDLDIEVKIKKNFYF